MNEATFRHDAAGVTSYCTDLVKKKKNLPSPRLPLNMRSNHIQFYSISQSICEWLGTQRLEREKHYGIWKNKNSLDRNQHDAFSMLSLFRKQIDE